MISSKQAIHYQWLLIIFLWCFYQFLLYSLQELTPAQQILYKLIEQSQQDGKNILRLCSLFLRVGTVFYFARVAIQTDNQTFS
jgi:hypothetical protein